MFEKVEVLQKRVTSENAFWEGVEKKVARFKSSAAVSDTFTAKLTRTVKSFETVQVEVALLKVQVARADVDKADSDKFVADFLIESEQLLVCLKFTLVGYSRAAKLRRLLVT